MSSDKVVKHHAVKYLTFQRDAWEKANEKLLINTHLKEKRIFRLLLH